MRKFWKGKIKPPRNCFLGLIRFRNKSWTKDIPMLDNQTVQGTSYHISFGETSKSVV